MGSAMRHTFFLLFTMLWPSAELSNRGPYTRDNVGVRSATKQTPVVLIDALWNAADRQSYDN